MASVFSIETESQTLACARHIDRQVINGFENTANIYAMSNYGGSFPSAIGLDNLFAVQFHAEKSAAVGLKLLENFAKWSGYAK